MSVRLCWCFLLASILLEAGGTSVMKISQASWPFMGMAIMYLMIGLSYYCLAKAVVRLPVGVAYVFWEALGLLLITLVSIFFIGEKPNLTRLLALAMVLIGAILVHIGTEGENPDKENLC